MDKTLTRWQIAGFVFTAAGGTLLHFLYDWIGQSMATALVSAINESVWEHMKLLFIPMFGFALLQSIFFGGKYSHFWCVKLIGILLGLILIPVLYYTYTGALGQSLSWVNIAIFYVAAAAVYAFETWLLGREGLSCRTPQLALLVLCVLAVAFVAWTFDPPQYPLFQDPISRLYGIGS